MITEAMGILMFIIKLHHLLWVSENLYNECFERSTIKISV